MVLVAALVAPACAADQQPTAPTKGAPAAAPAVERVGAAALQLPTGWRIAQRSDDGVVLDVGLPRAHAGDALALVVGGDVPAASQQLDAVELLRQQLPDVDADLRALGVVADGRRVAIQAGACAAGDGATATAPARAADGRAVRVWIGAAKAGDRWAAVVAIAARTDAGDAVLAGAAAVFASLAFPREPATTTAPAADLGDCEFGHASFGSDASLSTVYRFTAEGTVVRRTMFSSPLGGSDREEHGAFAVDGERVTIRCGDDVVVARIERRGKAIAALRIGSARYARTAGR